TVERGEIPAAVRGREPRRKREPVTAGGDVERPERTALSAGSDLEQASRRGGARRPAGDGRAAATVAALGAGNGSSECQREHGERGPEHRKLLSVGAPPLRACFRPRSGPG